MPTHTLAQPFNDFRGSLNNAAGDATLTLTKTPTGGFVSHRYFAPTDRHSADQAEVRAFFKQIATAFKTLSIAEVGTWRDGADLISRTDAPGAAYTWSPYSLFQAVNFHRLNRASTIARTYTIQTAVPPRAQAVTWCANIPPFLEILMYAPGLTNAKWGYLRISPAKSTPSRKAYPRECTQRAYSGQANYSLVQANQYGWHIYDPNVLFPAGSYVGLLLTRVQENFTPLPDPQFWPNILITPQ